VRGVCLLEKRSKQRRGVENTSLKAFKMEKRKQWEEESSERKVGWRKRDEGL
jgi:hypothetical protein